MSVAYKKMERKNPLNKSEKKYYAQLVVTGTAVGMDVLIARIKDKSSLSAGDIKSTIANFVEVMRDELLSGHSVSVADLGTFSLTARSSGSVTREDCSSANIKSVNIRFRAATAIKPSLKATRAEDRIEFVDVDTLAIGRSGSSASGGSTSGGGTNTGDTGSDGDDLGGNID